MKNYYWSFNDIGYPGSFTKTELSNIVGLSGKDIDEIEQKILDLNEVLYSNNNLPCND